MGRQPTKKTFKICLVVISMGRGGAERSTALLSKMLSRLGHKVFIVVLNNILDYEYEGELFNLGIYKSSNDTAFKRLYRFRKLKRFFKAEKFDLIIDNRTRVGNLKESMYLKYLYKNEKFIYVVRSYNIKEYLPTKNRLTKSIIKRAAAIVGVSRSISETINKTYETNKAVTIYNPVEEIQPAAALKNNKKFILFLGRIEENVKNFSLLLGAYKNSKLPENNIKLKIFGNGNDVELLLKKIKQYNLTEFVEHHPFQVNIFSILQRAKFLALTSYYEGFPRVLVEALSVGTPVVSVDCESGPSEIIKDGENGLLVENHNIEKLTIAFNRMALDEDLWQHCKQNAQESVAHLQMNEISQQWNKLIMQILN